MPQEKEDEQGARIAMLEHYTDQLTSHYNYFWTTVFIMVTLLGISGFDGILKVISGARLISARFLALGEGLLLGFAVWLFIKCIFYGKCCRSIYHVNPQGKGKMIFRLNEAVNRDIGPWSWIGDPIAFVISLPLGLLFFLILESLFSRVTFFGLP